MLSCVLKRDFTSLQNFRLQKIQSKNKMGNFKVNDAEMMSVKCQIFSFNTKAKS